MLFLSGHHLSPPEGHTLLMEKQLAFRYGGLALRALFYLHLAILSFYFLLNYGYRTGNITIHQLEAFLGTHGGWSAAIGTTASAWVFIVILPISLLFTLGHTLIWFTTKRVSKPLQHWLLLLALQVIMLTLLSFTL